MAETSMLWDSGAGGDASPHSESLTAALFAALAGVGGVNEGVLARVLNALAPSVSGANILVNSGWAVVDGHPYRNDASKSITPVTPSAGTTGRRVVLRCSWSAQTVRLVEISNTDGTSAIPAPTQVSGTTYEIPICSYTVTTGGVIGAFLDTRKFAFPISYADLVRGSLDAPRVLIGHMIGGQQSTTTGSAIGMGLSLAGSTPNLAALANSRSRFSAGSASNATYVSTGAVASVAPNRSPRMICRATPQQTDANLAYWLMGFVNNVSTSSPNGAYFRRSGTGNVFAVTDQGGETTTDLGALSDTTLRTWELYTPDDGVTWVFAINGAVAAVHTTGVPTASTQNQPVAGLTAAGGGGITASFDVEELVFDAKRAA